MSEVLQYYILVPLCRRYTIYVVRCHSGLSAASNWQVSGSAHVLPVTSTVHFAKKSNRLFANNSQLRFRLRNCFTIVATIASNLVTLFVCTLLTFVCCTKLNNTCYRFELNYQSENIFKTIIFRALVVKTLKDKKDCSNVAFTCSTI